MVWHEIRGIIISLLQTFQVPNLEPKKGLPFSFRQSHVVGPLFPPQS